jgi:hypothetical protein
VSPDGPESFGGSPPSGSEPLRALADPATRSRPCRFDVYIARSAAIISSSTVCPSPGKTTTPIDSDARNAKPGPSMICSEIDRRIFSARTNAPLGSVSGRTATGSSPP